MRGDLSAGKDIVTEWAELALECGVVGKWQTAEALGSVGCQNGRFVAPIRA